MPKPAVFTIDTDRIYSLGQATTIQGQIADQLNAPGSTGVVVDLAKVDYASSPFLAVLVASQKLAKERKLPFAVVGMKGVVKGLFGLVKLDHLIPLYNTVDEANTALK